MAVYHVGLNGKVTKNNKNIAYSVDANGRVTKLKDDEEELTEKEQANIAPVKEEKERTWVQAGRFDDGYQFGDGILSVLGTVGDVGLGIVQGAGQLVEGVTDAIGYGVAGVSDFFGADSFADDVRTFAKRDDVKSGFDFIREVSKIDDDSFLGEKGRGVPVALGQIGGIIATGGAGAAAGLGTFGTAALTTGVLSLSSTGSGMSEAYAGGATDAEAAVYGISKGVLDGASELIFGGLGKVIKATGLSHGLSSLDDVVAKALSNKITNKIINEAVKRVVGNTAEFGVKSAAEGLEEFIAGGATIVAKKLTYMSEEDIQKIAEDENLLEQFVVGALASGAMQTPGLRSSIKSDTDFVSGLSSSEDAVINKEVERRVALEEKESGNTVNKQRRNKIYDEVKSDMEKGHISTDTIEEVLGGETFNTYKSTVDSEDSLVNQEKTLRDEFNTLNRMKTGDRTGEQSDRLEELRTQLSDLTSKIDETKQNSQRDQLKTQLSEEVTAKLKGERNGAGSLLLESYNERTRRGQAFEADLSKYDDAQKKTVEAAIKSGILNNTNRAHEFVDTVAKISADKGVPFDFTNNKKLKESGFAIEGATVNGHITANGIALNMDSPKAWQSTVGHEITHVLEGTELYATLASTIKEYATSKGIYDSRYEAMKKLYTKKDANGNIVTDENGNVVYLTPDGKIDGIEAEVVADLVGDYIFTDADFVAHLSTKHRNVFQKIYDEIKYLAKAVTAGSKEARQLEQAKRAFEKAYKAQKNTADNSGTRYAISKDINGDTFVDVTENIFDPNNGESVARIIQKFIADRFNNLIDVKGQKIQINKTTNDEFRRSESVNRLLKTPSQAYNDKLKTIANADEILKAAKNWIGEKNKHNRNDDIVEFARASIMYRVGENGYVADVLVGTRKSGAAVLYDLVNIYEKKITEAPVTMASHKNSQRRQDASAKPIVPQEGKNVNTNFPLSEEQQEYFKDSVVRDENGNLKVMYHGTSQGGHTVFDPYGASRYGLFGLGTYFTDNKEIAESYTKKGKGKNPQVYETYLNITNPMDMDAQADPAAWSKVFPDADFPETGTNEDFYRAMEDYFEDMEYVRWEAHEAAMDAIMSMGYDGITHIGGGRVNADGPRHQVYIAFEPEQIKNADNIKPTSDADIRYSLSADSKDGDTYSRINEMQIELNRVRESIREFEKTEDFKKAMDNLSNSISNDDIENGVKAYQEWRIDSGYDALTSKREALQTELESLREEFNNSIASKAVEKEKNAIAKSGLSESEYFRKQAVKEFGYTPFFYDAGYITPNGKMLNFSGEKGKHFGSRGQDHRAIGVIYETTQGTDALNRFVNGGNIRIMAESPGIDVSSVVEPTNEQYATIRKFASEYSRKEFFSVDFSDESGRVVGSLTYENRINPIRVVNDIKHYYATGEIREPSSLDSFRYSLSENGVAPIGRGTPLRDLRLETAPEDIAPVTDTNVGSTSEQAYPLYTEGEGDDQLTAEDANAMRTYIHAYLDDADAPPEMDAPYYGDEAEQSAPADPFENRDIKDVGNRKVNAYMYENPEVKPFFQEEANIMLGELNRTIKGEKIYIQGDFGGYGAESYYRWTGTTRQTSEDIAYLLDELKYSYADIEKGLKAIIEDDGKENNAISKRIEFLLNDRLMNGYVSDDGLDIPANDDYIRLLNEKEIIEYNDEARQRFFENADAYAPADIAPVAETAKPGRSIAMDRAYEAITSKPKYGNKLVRADNVTAEQQRIAQVLDAEPAKTSKKSRAWAKFRANVFDKGSVFEDLSLKTKNRELMGKWNYMLYSEARAQRLIGNGAEGVKSLNAIIEEVGNTGKTKQFYEYLYHNLNIDRMTLAERYDDIENKPVFGDTVTANMSMDAVRQYESANPEFKRYAQDVYAYNNHLRQMLVEDGVISQETADLWAEMYPHFVPIRRAGKDGLSVNVPLDTGRTGVNAPVKKATGGSGDILPLFDTMAQRTVQTYRAIAKNSFGVELKNSLGTTISNENTSVDDVIDTIDTQDGLLQEGKNGRKPTFTVFEGGEKVTYEITEDMYDALKPMSEGMAYTNKALNAASNFHRGLLTEYNPVFMLTNAIKDAQDLLINSQHARKTYAKIPEAFAQLTKKGYWYQEYMANGGEQNSYFDNESNTFTFDTGHQGIAKLLDVPPLSTISKLNNFIEMTPRLAEYIASREAGRSAEVSMLDAARVTTNFRAGGDVTKFLNRNGATFLNASVQGAMQQVRNVREAKANGMKGWVNLATKFAIAGLPVLILNSLVWDDDEEYEELSDYVKQNYYIVGKTDSGKFIRIPKGRTLAVIQDAFDLVSDAMTGDDEVDLNRFLELGALVISNLAPNNPIEDNIAAPIIQVANNETWYGEDLVPTRLQDLPAGEQYDESTDAFSRWLGERVGISPYKINYLLDQYSGGLGDVVLPMMTPEAESGDDSFAGNLLAPLKSKFTVDSTMNNQNVSDFYETKDELTTNAKGSKATDEDILKSKYMNSINSEISALYAEKRAIQNSDLPDSTKYDMVRNIQSQIVDLTKKALDAYDDISYSDEYAMVGDKYFKQNDDGEWQKLSDDQTTKYEITSAAGNSSYATDGNLHFRWYQREGEAEGEWRKITDKELEKQEEVTKGLGISASDYWSNKEEYDYAYEYPENYAVAKVVGGYDSFKAYSSELNDIKADKDSDGKTISGSRKDKVLDYINNLDADYGEKIILFKSEYTADDTYNYDIIDYLNSRDDISRKEKETILRKLGFTVSRNGDISW